MYWCIGQAKVAYHRDIPQQRQVACEPQHRKRCLRETEGSAQFKSAGILRLTLNLLNNVEHAYASQIWHICIHMSHICICFTIWHTFHVSCCGVTTSLRQVVRHVQEPREPPPASAAAAAAAEAAAAAAWLGAPKIWVWLLDVEVNCWVLLSLCVVNVECFLIFFDIPSNCNIGKRGETLHVTKWQNQCLVSRMSLKINAWCQEVSAAKTTCVSASHFGGRCVLLHFMFSKPLSLAVWGRQEPLRNK